MSNKNCIIRVHVGHQLPEGLPSPDVYFTSGYGRAAGVMAGGKWGLLEAYNGAWQVPLIVRTLVDGTKDAISPYGYSGVYASPSMSSVQVAEAWSATVNRLRELGVISMLLRHSPLVPQASDLSGLRPIISGHPTIVLEPADSDAAWTGMEKNCRKRIRKALKNGYVADVRQATVQDLASGGNFRRLYEETMQRLDASPQYFFGDDYYTELIEGLGSNLLIAEVKDPTGAVAASALLMRHEQRLHTHLSCSKQEDAQMGTNNLSTWASTQYAIEQGIRQIHLGGGVSPRDSLFTFKRSFGGRELEFNVSGLIIDHELYQVHTKNRAEVCDVTTDTLLASNYFPAYRGGTPRV